MKGILLKWPFLACQIQNSKAFKIRVLGVKYHWKSKKQSNFNISFKAFFEYRTSKKFYRDFFLSLIFCYIFLYKSCVNFCKDFPQKREKSENCKLSNADNFLSTYATAKPYIRVCFRILWSFRKLSSLKRFA